MAQVPGLDPALIGDVIVGCAMPEAEQGMNVARIGLLLAGCRHRAGHHHQPLLLFRRAGRGRCCQPDPPRPGRCDDRCRHRVDERDAADHGQQDVDEPGDFQQGRKLGIAFGMGLTAEKVAKQWKISREEQDAFAVASNQKACAAIAAGHFKAETTPYADQRKSARLEERVIKLRERTVDTDEGPRQDSSMANLAKLKPVFHARGSVTAGNSSQMSDGAAAVMIVSEKILREHNLTPLARFAGYAVAGVAPEIMGIGPIAAIPKVLKQVGITQDQLDWIELNEAFAAQAIAVMKELGINPDKVNPLGGAIALGHPLGATGAIRIATLAHGLKRTGGKYGMVSMCIGTGMGAAGIIERL
jgi:acetyl-CoA acyltransferase